MATSTDLRAAIEEIRQTMGPVEGKVRRPELKDALEHADEDWRKKLEERIGTVPWWMLSSIVHGVLLILVSVLAVAVPAPRQTDEVIIEVAPPSQPVAKYHRVKRPAFTDQRRIFENIDPHPVRPVLARKVQPQEFTRHVQTIADSQPRGRAEPLSDIPLGRQGFGRTIGAGQQLASGTMGYIRGEGKPLFARKGGGGADTENAVGMALAWLARNQEADGHWDSRKHDITSKSRPAHTTDRADTALALLAFLGSGHTPKSRKYGDNVRRAILWLVKQQGTNGAFFTRKGGHVESAGYQQAICGLALAEAYAMTRSGAVRRAAQKAVDFSVNKHQKPYSGWRYDPKSGADLSVTGWFVMQLKSAKMAGLRVDGAGFQGAAQFVDKVSDKQGRCGYKSNRGVNPTMTAVGMLCRQFMGMRNTHALIRGGANYLGQHRPVGGAKANRKTFYYWYYGTLAMFQVGGPEWKAWNRVMKKTLLESQRTKGAERGSWDPAGKYDHIAGRVYTTAMGALTLEVYYRYLQMYPR